MRSFLLSASIAVAAVGLAQTAVAADRTASAKAEILLKATEAWNGEAYKKYPDGKPELTMVKITIAPHTKLPWHTHPVPNAVYVLSGDLTIEEKESGKKRSFHEGEAFAETVDNAHRGMAGDRPVTVLLMYSGAAGVPVSVPLNAKEKEY